MQGKIIWILVDMIVQRVEYEYFKKNLNLALKYRNCPTDFYSVGQK